MVKVVGKVYRIPKAEAHQENHLTDVSQEVNFGVMQKMSGPRTGV